MSRPAHPLGFDFDRDFDFPDYLHFNDYTCRPTGVTADEKTILK